jgi:hypothetical protein
MSIKIKHLSVFKEKLNEGTRATSALSRAGVFPEELDSVYPAYAALRDRDRGLDFPEYRHTGEHLVLKSDHTNRIALNGRTAAEVREELTKIQFPAGGAETDKWDVKIEILHPMDNEELQQIMKDIKEKIAPKAAKLRIKASTTSPDAFVLPKEIVENRKTVSLAGHVQLAGDVDLSACEGLELENAQENQALLSRCSQLQYLKTNSLAHEAKLSVPSTVKSLCLPQTADLARIENPTGIEHVKIDTVQDLSLLNGLSDFPQLKGLYLKAAPGSTPPLPQLSSATLPALAGLKQLILEGLLPNDDLFTRRPPLESLILKAPAPATPAQPLKIGPGIQNFSLMVADHAPVLDFSTRANDSLFEQLYLYAEGADKKPMVVSGSSASGLPKCKTFGLGGRGFAVEDVAGFAESKSIETLHLANIAYKKEEAERIRSILLDAENFSKLKEIKIQANALEDKLFWEQMFSVPLDASVKVYVNGNLVSRMREEDDDEFLSAEDESLAESLESESEHFEDALEEQPIDIELEK